MNRKMIFVAIIVLAAVSLACSVNINLPNTQVKTGPTVTDTINVPLLKDTQTVADVTFQFGAGTFTLQSGAKNALVDGTASYNVSDFKPTVTVNGNTIKVEQGNFKLTGIPSFTKNIVNDWKLSLGTSPMNLVINAGAYTGNYELGGLSLQSLQITDGASKVDVGFSQSNLVPMSSLTYTTGASQVTLTGLANAGPAQMTFRSGAGDYKLDFSGDLRNDMIVNIESGVSTVTVIVPQGVNAVVNAESGLMTVSPDGSWQQNGSTYTLSGTGNTITINVKMGAGTLKLESGTPSTTQ